MRELEHLDDFEGLGGNPRKAEKRTPWQRIRDAAELGKGCRLSADEVSRLAFDGAIMTRAELDDAGEDG